MIQKVLIYLEINPCLSSSFPWPELSRIEIVIYLLFLSIYKDQAKNAYVKYLIIYTLVYIYTIERSLECTLGLMLPQYLCYRLSRARSQPRTL